MGEPEGTGRSGGIERRSRSEQGKRRRALFDILHMLERTACTGVLHLEVDGHQLGWVVACEGRLCFAVAGPDEPLASFADGGDAVAREWLGEMAREARRAGRSLCATMLEEPKDTVVRLCAQMRLEAAVAVRMMAECSLHFAMTHWLEHARGDYDPRLTFAAAEVYCVALQLDEPFVHDPVRNVFDGFQYSGDAGVLLVCEIGRESFPYPVASYGLSSASLHDLLTLCRSAGALMRPSAVQGQVVEPTYAVLQDAGGRHWVCVGAGRHVALIERRDGADLAPIVVPPLGAP